MQWRVYLVADGTLCINHVEGEDELAAKRAAIRKVRTAFGNEPEIARPEIRVKFAERIPA